MLKTWPSKGYRLMHITEHSTVTMATSGTTVARSVYTNYLVHVCVHVI